MDIFPRPLVLGLQFDDVICLLLLMEFKLIRVLKGSGSRLSQPNACAEESPGPECRNL